MRRGRSSRSCPFVPAQRVWVVELWSCVDVELSEEALSELSALATSTSLRHALQLLTPAKIIAQTYSRDVLSYVLAVLVMV